MPLDTNIVGAIRSPHPVVVNFFELPNAVKSTLSPLGLRGFLATIL